MACISTIRKIQHGWSQITKAPTAINCSSLDIYLSYRETGENVASSMLHTACTHNRERGRTPNFRSSDVLLRQAATKKCFILTQVKCISPSSNTDSSRAKWSVHLLIKIFVRYSKWMGEYDGKFMVRPVSDLISSRVILGGSIQIVWIEHWTNWKSEPKKTVDAIRLPSKLAENTVFFSSLCWRARMSWRKTGNIQIFQWIIFFAMSVVFVFSPGQKWIDKGQNTKKERILNTTFHIIRLSAEHVLFVVLNSKWCFCEFGRNANGADIYPLPSHSSNVRSFGASNFGRHVWYSVVLFCLANASSGTEQFCGS